MARLVHYQDARVVRYMHELFYFEEAVMMKTLLLRLIFFISAVLVLAPWPAFPSDLGLRLTLGQAPGVHAVYAVDRTHTFVLGRLEPLEGRTYRVLGSYEGGGPGSLTGFMLEHPDEPMAVDGAASSLDFLREGPVRLTHGPLSVKDDGYSSLDVYEAATISCLLRGAHPIYVIPKKYGRFKRLTEVEGVEAFRYLLLSGADGVWFVACDGKGDARFQIMKNYNFVNDDKEVVELSSGVVLEGVDYVKNSRLEEKRLADLQGRWPASRTTLEETAREIARIKTGFIKNVGGKRYYGTYKGTDSTGRCASVSLERKGLEDKAMITVVRDYRVCGGKVSVTGYLKSESMAERAGVVYRRAGGTRFAERR